MSHLPLIASTLLLAAALGSSSAGQCPLVELLPPGVGLGDRFGETVVLDGAQLWVGAPGTNALTGTVYRLTQDGVILGSFVPPGGTPDQVFGRALAVQGPRVLVGSPGKDIPVQDAGEAWLYEHDGSVWQATRLTSSLPSKNGRFGLSVALEGDRAFVGEPAYGSVEPGRVHIFRAVGGAWQHEAALTAPLPQIVSETFGASLAVDGDRLAVGAPRDADDAGPVGAVHVFGFDGTAWALQQSIYGTAASNDGNGFGTAVSLDGDTLVVGATGLLIVNTATVYRDGPGGFTLEATLNQGNPLERFGWAVHVRGDRLLVGAPRWNSSPVPPPRTYVFDRVGVDWSLTATLTSAAEDGDSHFGTSLDQDDTRLLVGAVPLGHPTHLTGVTLFDSSQLEWADTWHEVGVGVPGTAGLPEFWVDGPLCEGGFVLLRAWNLPPSSDAWLVVGLSTLGQPFKGGTLWPFPDVIEGPWISGPDGVLDREVPLTLPVPPGLELVLQYWAPDGGAPQGWAATPGLAGTTAP